MLTFGHLKNYEGPLPLFPLPNVVFFPNTFLPLHIFEPRYRQMVKDSKERDGLIGMVLLKPGWENQYYENPPIYETACVGQIIRLEAQGDGRYNILLRGLSRVKIAGIHSSHPYRSAKVQVIPENAKPLSPRKEAQLRRDLFEAFSRVIEPPHWGFTVFSAPHLELGVLADLIAFSLPADPDDKQKILDAALPEKRVQELISILETEEEVGRRVRVKQLPFLHELARS